MVESQTLRDELKDALGETEALGVAGEHPGVEHPSVEHPSVEELLSYASGGQTSRPAGEIEEHLTRCRTCLDLVLDMDAFLQPEEEADTDSLATARGWRELRSRLPGRLPPRRILALAASVLLVLGLSLLLLSQHRRVEELSARLEVTSTPQADAPILDLFPQGAVRAPGEQSSPRVPADAFVVLVLNLPDAEPGGRFTAELVDAAGEVLWSGRLSLSDYGTFRLGLPGHVLGPPGGEIRLYAGQAGDRRLLETFPLEVGPFEVGPLEMGSGGEEAP